MKDTKKNKKTTDKPTYFLVNPGHKKGTTTEILRNPNLSIKTPKKSTDEQTSRQQISFSGTLYCKQYIHIMNILPT